MEGIDYNDSKKITTMEKNDYRDKKNDCSDFLIVVIVPLNHRNRLFKERFDNGKKY
jgi:hypothetical protein